MSVGQVAIGFSIIYFCVDRCNGMVRRQFMRCLFLWSSDVFDTHGGETVNRFNWS
jgi:hypothetical protein